MLGNAWSAVARLRSVETEPWLAMASDMKDGDVKKAMVAMGKENVSVGIIDSSNCLQITRRAN